jgi:hypothetical protein
MKRHVFSHFCAALLFWAAFNDVLAAQTPEVDDDLAAAMDNDYIQCAPVNVPSRATAHPLWLGQGHHSVLVDMAGARAALRATSFHPLLASLTNPLYQFMSLQR